MLAVGFVFLAGSMASAETRSLKLYFIHTGEKAEIVFKRNGSYDQAGLQKINRFLRDWRRNEPTKMDPRLMDLVWEAYRESGSNDYIHVVCGYRSPSTNSMLRSRSKGVAQKSQHMLGKAMDFYIPGVKLKRLREIGLKMQGGGVGYYPTSGSPFVHFDVGNVRHWPKMSRQELVALFPNGKTLHVPSDGKPLPGFDQALASYQARKRSGNVAVASAGNSTTRSGGFLAAFFGGGGADDEEDSSGVTVASAPEPKAVAAQPKPVKNNSGIRIVAPEDAQPVAVAAAVEDEAPVEKSPEKIIAALPLRNVPLPGAAPRPQADVGVTEVAAATPPSANGWVEGAPGVDAPVVEAEAAPAQVALNIPLPTRRPDYATKAAPVEAAPVDPILMALAEADVQPSAAKEAMAIAAPLPAARPQAAEDVLTVASLPDTAPFPAAPDEIIPEPKSSRVASVATPRAALAARPKGADPASAVRSNVKTTAKSARATANDHKPDPKPMVVAAQPQAARWALHNDYVAKATGGTTAPSFAYNIVRTAPSEVYTAGFQQETKMADANKFTGKAVTFMSVAKFQTN